MSRSSEPRSAVFRIASLLFVITLFCDAANLDDLFSSFVVLHDDIDFIAPGLRSNTASIARISQMQHQVLAPLRVVRLIIDQDSPAVAADTVQTAFTLLALFRDTAIRLRHQEIPAELLHLRNHSFLI